MKYMLDTNICIYIIKHKPIEVIKKFLKLKRDDVCISAITYSELEYGVSKSKNVNKNRLALTLFLSNIQIMPYDDIVAFQYGEIRTEIEKKGKVIGPMDMLIAAHARTYGLILVTNNVSEFKRVNNLRIENWVNN